MKTLTAKDAKYGFGRLIDLAPAEPVSLAKCWWWMVTSVEGARSAEDRSGNEAEIGLQRACNGRSGTKGQVC